MSRDILHLKLPNRQRTKRRRRLFNFIFIFSCLTSYIIINNDRYVCIHAEPFDTEDGAGATLPAAHEP